jgi:hypothetical protein
MTGCWDRTCVGCGKYNQHRAWPVGLCGPCGRPKGSEGPVIVAEHRTLFVLFEREGRGHTGTRDTHGVYETYAGARKRLEEMYGT